MSNDDPGAEKVSEHPTRWTGWRRKIALQVRRTWHGHWKLITAWSVTALVAVTVAIQLLPSQAPTQSPYTGAENALVVGIPGLRWNDVDPDITPTLWSLAEEGSIGSLAVDSATTTTCPLDGWLTVAAGAPATGSVSLTEDICPPVPPEAVENAEDSSGAAIPRLRDLARENRDEQFGAEVGALSNSVQCATAVGPGAAFASARPTGRVDRYEPSLPDDSDSLAQLLDECELSMIDLGSLPENDSERDDAVRRADAMMADIVEATPPATLTLIAGLSDTSAAAHLHAVIAVGDGFDGGRWLTSAGTGREGYLRLVDLAPTVIAALDRPLPRQITGVTAATLGGRDADTHSTVTQLADDDAEAAAQEDAIMRFLFFLTLAVLALFVLSTPVLQRIRHGVDFAGRGPPTVWTFRAIVSAAAALSLTLPAATLVDFIPWWRFDRTMVALLASTALIAAVMTVLVFMAPKRRSPLGLMITVSLAGVTVVALDVLTGGRLQFDGIAAYSALNSAGRAGLAPLGFGVFATSLLMAAGCAAQSLRRRYRPVLIALAGSVGVLIVGAPFLGNDPVGVVALTVGVCLAAVMSTGGWLTFGRFAWASFAGVALLVTLAISDAMRAESARGPLGGFVADLFGGDGGGRVRATMEADMVAIGSNPLTLLLLGSIVFAWVVLLRPSGGLKRAFGLYPSVRAGFVGAVVATLLGGLMGGHGFIPLGAGAAITMPLAIIMAQRVLARSHVRDGSSEPADLEVPTRGAQESSGTGVTVESRG